MTKYLMVGSNKLPEAPKMCPIWNLVQLSSGLYKLGYKLILEATFYGRLEVNFYIRLKD